MHTTIGSGRIWLVLLGLFTILLELGSGTPMWAQANYTAQLTGVVSDSSGAVIPGVKVTLTEESTNLGVTRETDSRGIYVFTGLRPSTYKIRVEVPQFASQERNGVVLAVSQQATIDFTLTPGTVAESVTVSGQAPLLDTGSASLGTDVTNEYVRDIPLPDRSFFGLGISHRWRDRNGGTRHCGLVSDGD